MYNFIDVNEVSDGASLPSEALRINGEYIENLIEGYRTLTVSGREALSPDVYSIETGSRDGTRLQKKRYPERIIVVQYRLSAKSNEAFREAYNKLGRILDVEEAELIFEDEKDKYFIGTPCIIGSVDPGKNTVVGEFEILCTDPFKYSVEEYEATSDGTAITIDYNGTYKSYPTLVSEFYREEEVSADGESNVALTGNGDCGFVAFYNDNEQILQFGDPTEVDKEAAPESQTMMNQTFLTNVAWGTGAKKLWKVNENITVPSEPLHIGTVGMKTSGESAGELVGTHYMTATSYGNATGKWHGANITRELGADASGEVGATDFLVSFRHKMSIGNNKGDTAQYGRFCVHLLDADNKIVMGVDIHKYIAGKKAAMALYVGTERAKGVEIDLSYNNKYLGHGTTTSYMRKTGSEFVFNMVGHRYSFKRTDLESLMVKKVMVLFDSYSDKPPLTHNGLFWLKFVKQNCDTWANVPNKFGANDVLEADCKNSEVLLNGTPMPELGALGNDWEKFYLTPGINVIDTTYSNWVDSDHAPSFKVRYREVFL